MDPDLLLAGLQAGNTAALARAISVVEKPAPASNGSWPRFIPRSAGPAGSASPARPAPASPRSSSAGHRLPSGAACAWPSSRSIPPVRLPAAPCSATASAWNPWPSTRASSSAPWPVADRSAVSPPRPAKSATCSMPPASTASWSKRWASASPSWTSPAWRTRRCSSWCPSRATASRRSSPASWRSPTCSWSTRPTVRARRSCDRRSRSRWASGAGNAFRHVPAHHGRAWAGGEAGAAGAR